MPTLNLGPREHVCVQGSEGEKTENALKKQQKTEYTHQKEKKGE